VESIDRHKNSQDAATARMPLLVLGGRAGSRAGALRESIAV